MGKEIIENSPDRKHITPATAFRDPKNLGVSRRFSSDIYYFLISATWTQLFSIITSFYFLVNLVFGFLYYLSPSSISGVSDQSDYWSYFFFSVQSMSTIGYGGMLPVSHYANALVTIEAIFGIFGVAAITGLVFAKFSRPTSKVLFSQDAIVYKRNGVDTLSFRVGNARGNDIVDATINLSLLVEEVTQEGEELRRVYDLPLLRSRTPFFRLTWSVMHEINEDSPLKKLCFGQECFDDNFVALMVTLVGHDGSYGQTIFDRYVYGPQNIKFNKRFVDIIEESDDGQFIVDYNHFHDLQDLNP